MKSIYFTTPIYYVNAEPHMGHLYTTALADMLKKFYRLNGFDVFFQTGTDEHGEKIAQSAKTKGISPMEFTTQISEKFKDTWKAIDIDLDNFIRTTDKNHIEFVQNILTKVYEAKNIYFDEYVGKYCVGCERYLTDQELVDGKCPDHQMEPEERKEANYFFKMSKYQQRLIEYIEKNPTWIRPQRYKNEVLSLLKKPLEDLCISRPKTRLEWGIELPFDKDYVTYVWFDALLNYVSGITKTTDGQELFSKYWSSCNHLIAKDILKTHAIYWPTMLMSAGIDLFKQLDVHGYWMMGESKMSKTLGNVVRPLEFHNQFGIENLRYVLFKEMKFGSDSNFTYDLFIERYNSDLANGLGNLLSRNAGLVAQNFGAIPDKTPITDDEKPIIEKCKELEATYVGNFENREFSKSIEDVISLVSVTDKYITQMEPWKVAKNPDQKQVLARILRTGLEAVRISCIYLWPIMPQKCSQILSYLGENRPLDGSVPLSELVAYDALTPGHSIEKPPAFFPRIDASKINQEPEAAQKKQEKPKTTKAPKKEKKEEITIDDFVKIDLKVGQIKEAYHVEGADKLLRLMVNLGEEKPRQIFAGIKATYKNPEELIGKKVSVVANLQPRKMRFGLSEGMILAASGDNRLSVVTFDENAKPGDNIG